MPESGKIVINDLIRGRIEFEAALLDDPIILKSDGFPTYHLAAVVDDHEMGITHIIRAEDWLSSTPKHHTLYEAFGWPEPGFAHLPMVLGPDKKKLSKRHGATAVLEYKKNGYLPDAMVNFLALLGWNPKDEREEFSLEQLIGEFEIKNINKSPAIFNIDKLNNINELYIRSRDPGQLKTDLETIVGIKDLTEGEIKLARRGGFKTLVEISDYLEKLRGEPIVDTKMLIFKKSDLDRTRKGLNLARQKLARSSIWSEERLQNLLMECVEEGELTNGDVFWPVRVALSGEEKSPSPVELLVALDRAEALKRIDTAIKKFS
jgi:glutamyl-tRNA synthetase